MFLSLVLLIQYNVYHTSKFREYSTFLPQDKCGVEPASMLDDEIAWVGDFEVPTSAEYAESSSARLLDNTLLTGHLRLLKTLVAGPDVDKKKTGEWDVLPSYRYRLEMISSRVFCRKLFEKLRDKYEYTNQTPDQTRDAGERVFFCAGSRLITKLLHEFLFPASKLILDGSSQIRNKRLLSDFQPK